MRYDKPKAQLVTLALSFLNICISNYEHIVYAKRNVGIQIPVEMQCDMKNMNKPKP